MSACIPASWVCEAVSVLWFDWVHIGELCLTAGIGRSSFAWSREQKEWSVGGREYQWTAERKEWCYLTAISIHNEVDLIWSILGFPWEIYFVQSVLASPKSVTEFTGVNFCGLKCQYKEIWCRIKSHPCILPARNCMCAFKPPFSFMFSGHKLRISYFLQKNNDHLTGLWL